MPFPRDFLWGISVSAFQFEMGGKKEDWDTNTDWWVWVHDRKNIQKRVVSGDLPENGVNYWELYAQDHKLASDRGFKAWRFAPEWSRIFPESTEKVEVGVEKEGELISKIEIDESTLRTLDTMANHRALNHYREVIEDLRDRGFTVFLCLNHFTLPLWIHDPITARDSRLSKGPRGWLDERTVVEFTKYAAYMAWKLGDLVDYWSTLCEPATIFMSYLIPTGFPPNVLKVAPHLSRFPFAKVAFNMLQAHARAYDAVKRWDRKRADRKSSSPAEVGIIYNVIPAYPLRKNHPVDKKACEFHDYLTTHWFLQAISFGWLDAGYNPKKRREEKCLKQRLDWLGVNYYSRDVVRGWVFPLLRMFGAPVVPQPVPGYGMMGGVRSLPIFNPGQITPTHENSLEGFPVSDFCWEVYPEGLRASIEQVKQYSRILYITENGIADERDRLRPRFLIEHLGVLEKLIEEGTNIKGYFHWSLVDNYEWARGFAMKFGLCAVDLKSKKRKARPSLEVFSKIIEKGEVPKGAGEGI